MPREKYVIRPDHLPLGLKHRPNASCLDSRIHVERQNTNQTQEPSYLWSLAIRVCAFFDSREKLIRGDRRNGARRGRRRLHPTNHGRMVAHNGDTGIGVQQILHAQLAKGGCGRHLPLGRTTKGGIVDSNLIKKVNRPFRRLKRFDNNRVAFFTNGHHVCGYAEFWWQLDGLFPCDVDDLSSGHFVRMELRSASNGRSFYYSTQLCGKQRQLPRTTKIAADHKERRRSSMAESTPRA